MKINNYQPTNELCRCEDGPAPTFLKYHSGREFIYCKKCKKSLLLSQEDAYRNSKEYEELGKNEKS